MSKFKVGDIVTPLTNKYPITQLGTRWKVIDFPRKGFIKVIGFSGNGYSDFQLDNDGFKGPWNDCREEDFKNINSYIIRKRLGIK